MSQDQGDEKSDVGTFADAQRERKESIAELRKGDETDQLLANVLAQCRKGKRCYREECPVCERRKKSAARRIPKSAVKSMVGTFTSYIVENLYLDAVKVPRKHRPLNEEKVRAIAASIQQVGLRTPITVREQKNQVILVAGLHRLEAVRRLGWDAIPCFTIEGDETESRPWEIAENLYRAELTALQRAEHIDELRVLIQQKTKGGQVAPPRGGAQPKDAAINRTAKALGFTKEDVRRAKKIAGISQEARAEAKRLGLDDNQRALLQIAKLPTPTAQLLAVKEIDERIRAAQARRAAAVTAVQADTTAAAKIKTIQADITEMMDEAQGLNNELDRKRNRLRSLQEQLVADCVDKVPIITTADSPATAPEDDLAIPPADERPPLSPEEKESLAAMVAAWNKASKLRRAWEKASTRVRQRFIEKIAGQSRRETEQTRSTRAGRRSTSRASSATRAT